MPEIQGNNESVYCDYKVRIPLYAQCKCSCVYHLDFFSSLAHHLIIRDALIAAFFAVHCAVLSQILGQTRSSLQMLPTPLVVKLFAGAAKASCATDALFQLLDNNDIGGIYLRRSC